MIRTLFVLAILGGIGFLVVAWAGGGPEPSEKSQQQDSGNKNSARPGQDQPGREGNPNASQRATENLRLEKAKAVKVEQSQEFKAPLTLHEARASVIHSQEVSANRQGQLIILGREISKEQYDQLAPQKRAALRISYVEITNNREDPNGWREWNRRDEVEPNKVQMNEKIKYFRRLEEHDQVAEGEILGLIDPTLALADLDIKIAKINSSEAKRGATEKTRDEALKRFESLRIQESKFPRSVPQEELRGAELTWLRYCYELVSESQNVIVAKRELNQSQKVVDMHEMKASITGVVKTIYKKQGEAVKEQEPVLLIQDPDALRIEGYVELQEAKKLEAALREARSRAKNLPVLVEPAQPDSPRIILRGHTQAINDVAVSKDAARPLVISASEDHTVRVWQIRREKSAETGKDTWMGREMWILKHPTAVRSVACTGPEATRNLCLSGSVGGTARLWDLDNLEKEPEVLSNQHQGPINAAAFNKDGTICATGSEDRSICLWNVKEGQLLHRLPLAHKGALTSLQFTPDNRLVSAGRDNRLIVWKLEDGKAPEPVNQFLNRSGQVEQIGVNPVGTRVLFDQGKQLVLQSLDDKSIKGIIVPNTSAAIDFTTMALFSPDGQMVLSAAASNNRVQLWRNPEISAYGRAAELRQYIWNDSPATCGAFAPYKKDSFAVTGTQDRHVLVWALPTDDEVKQHGSNAFLKSIDPFRETDSRQVRIVVEAEGKIEGLSPGSTATMVIYPK